MNEASRKPRSIIVLILVVGLCVGPFVIALILYNNPAWLSGSTQHGTLINPAIPIDRAEFFGFDRFSAENIKEIRGHWVLVHFLSDQGCGDACRKSLDKTRQVRLMLNKDLMRVRRVAVLPGNYSEDQAKQWWVGHRYLLRIRSTRKLEDLVTSIAGNPVPEGIVIIMDPMGNFMMWYAPDFDPYQLKKDLKRLLRVSQIG